jgi:hypothetical protein
VAWRARASARSICLFRPQSLRPSRRQSRRSTLLPSGLRPGRPSRSTQVALPPPPARAPPRPVSRARARTHTPRARAPTTATGNRETRRPFFLGDRTARSGLRHLQQKSPRTHSFKARGRRRPIPLLPDSLHTASKCCGLWRANRRYRRRYSLLLFGQNASCAASISTSRRIGEKYLYLAGRRSRGTAVGFAGNNVSRGAGGGAVAAFAGSFFGHQ